MLALTTGPSQDTACPDGQSCVPSPHTRGSHLDLQLLDHLHLHAALGRAPVIQSVFCVEVS